MTTPRWVVLPAALGMLLVALPLAGLLSKVPWPGLWELLTSQSSLAALQLSILTASVSTVFCIVLGVPMALVLARHGLRWLRPLVLLPLVRGLALLFTFGRMGLIGQYLEAAGIRIAFSTVAVILAQTFVSLPFLVMGLEGALRTAGDRYERVAATLGASPTRTLFTVTLPLVFPGLLSGAVLSFARALGEFGATLTFAGSLQGRTRTLPLEIYLQREADPDAAIALSLLLVIFAGIVMVIAYGKGRTRS